ncbi:MAG: SgcJ/EcaC family oxidoreductase [Methylotenera sp.]|nr:SgcJ/EcaC family oxidoreductase [Methylotenera sp.]
MNNRSIIEAANAEWNKALNSGNAKGLAALYTENAILSPGNGKALVGRAEIENLFKGFVDGGVHNHTLEIIEVGGSDKMIYQIARWSAQGAEANGETPSFGGITTNVLEQSSDGNWLARTHIWNVTQ